MFRSCTSLSQCTETQFCCKNVCSSLNGYYCKYYATAEDIRKQVHSNSFRLTAGIIVAIVIASIVFLAAFISLCLRLYRRRTLNNARRSLITPEAYSRQPQAVSPQSQPPPGALPPQYSQSYPLKETTSTFSPDDEANLYQNELYPQQAPPPYSEFAPPPYPPQ